MYYAAQPVPEAALKPRALSTQEDVPQPTQQLSRSTSVPLTNLARDFLPEEKHVSSIVFDSTTLGKFTVTH